MISIAHKLPNKSKPEHFDKEVANLLANYEHKDGYSHHRIVTMPDPAKNVLLTFWQSKKHYRRATTQ